MKEKKVSPDAVRCDQHIKPQAVYGRKSDAPDFTVNVSGIDHPMVDFVARFFAEHEGRKIDVEMSLGCYELMMRADFAIKDDLWNREKYPVDQFSVIFQRPADLSRPCWVKFDLDGRAFCGFEVFQTSIRGGSDQ